jgi:protein-disulfide isomerase
MLNMRFVPLLLVCALGFAAEPKAKSAFDKPTLEDYVRHLLVFAPGVQVKIDDPTPSTIAGLKKVAMHVSFGPNEETLDFYVSDNGRYLINITQGGVYDITKDPFQEDLDKLNTAGAPNFGTPGAPISLVVFSDFECPQCKMEAEALRKELLAAFPTQVHLYYKDFPLESLHPWAKPAAATGRCVLQQGQDHFWNYYDWVYANQGDIKADNFRSKVDDFAKNEKLDLMQFGRCMDNPAAVGAEVDKEIAEGKALNLNGTPTIFVNGRRLMGAYPWDNLKAIIQADLDYQKTHPATTPNTTASATDEKCCEVTIPTALKK